MRSGPASSATAFEELECLAGANDQTEHIGFRILGAEHEFGVVVERVVEGVDAFLHASLACFIQVRFIGCHDGDCADERLGPIAQAFEQAKVSVRRRRWAPVRPQRAPATEDVRTPAVTGPTAPPARATTVKSHQPHKKLPHNLPLSPPPPHRHGPSR